MANLDDSSISIGILCIYTGKEKGESDIRKLLP